MSKYSEGSALGSGYARDLQKIKDSTNFEAFFKSELTTNNLPTVSSDYYDSKREFETRWNPSNNYQEIARGVSYEHSHRMTTPSKINPEIFSYDYTDGNSISTDFIPARDNNVSINSKKNNNA